MINQLVVFQLRLSQLVNDPSGITGNIWFESESYAFPEKNWNDFAETITGLWVATLIDIYRSRNKWYEKKLIFMDGPYEVVLHNSNPTTAYFRSDNYPESTFHISLVDFAREIVAGRRQLLHHAIAVGWKKSAYAELEQCDWLESML